MKNANKKYYSRLVKYSMEYIIALGYKFRKYNESFFFNTDTSNIDFNYIKY